MLHPTRALVRSRIRGSVTLSTRTCLPQATRPRRTVLLLPVLTLAALWGSCQAVLVAALPKHWWRFTLAHADFAQNAVEKSVQCEAWKPWLAPEALVDPLVAKLKCHQERAVLYTWRITIRVNTFRELLIECDESLNAKSSNFVLSSAHSTLSLPHVSEATPHIARTATLSAV